MRDSSSDPTAAPAQHFGFTTFRPGQREVVDVLLGRGRSLAVFPTGGGKSIHAVLDRPRGLAPCRGVVAAAAETSSTSPSVRRGAGLVHAG